MLLFIIIKYLSNIAHIIIAIKTITGKEMFQISGQFRLTCIKQLYNMKTMLVKKCTEEFHNSNFIRLPNQFISKNKVRQIRIKGNFSIPSHAFWVKRGMVG